MKGKENKQPPNRPILLTGVQIKSHMISDSAGHVARSWSGLPAGRKSQCVTAQRAFLSSFLNFFPPLSLFSCTVNVLLSGQVHGVPKRQLSYFSLLLDAVTATGRCLLVEIEGAKSRFQLCFDLSPISPSPGLQIQKSHKNHVRVKKKKNKEGMERSDWGRRKKIQTEKTETSYPMENFKGQVPFLLFFAYFSCDFFFFFFFGESKRGKS